MSDLLERALRDLGMSGVFYSASTLAAPWGIEMPMLPDTMIFHLVTRGRMAVHVGEHLIEAEQGAIVLVPHGLGHTITDHPSSTATPLFSLPRVEVGERYERIQMPGPGAVTELVCGAVSFSGLAAKRLMSSLPPILEVNPDTEDQTWVRATFDVLALECQAERPGADVITARIADVLVVQAIRAWLAVEEPPGAWTAGLSDPRIGAAMAAVHDDPAADWTLTAMAQRAHLSRSGFAARFTQLVGQSPMSYVTDWRMDLAARMITEQQPLSQVARAVGYRSEPSFHRAFRRSHGMTPGEYARRRPSFGARLDEALRQAR